MSQFLPNDVEQALVALLKSTLGITDVQPLAEKDFDNNGELIFNPPSARTLFTSTKFRSVGDNTETTYDCEHYFSILGCAENLLSSESQRSDTLTQVTQPTLLQLAGARLTLADGYKSSPTRLLAIDRYQEQERGTVYIVTIACPGMSQWPGVNA
jgi:hypothetical protein